MSKAPPVRRGSASMYGNDVPGVAVVPVMVGIDVDDPADRQVVRSLPRSGSVRFSAEDLADEGDAEEKADEYDLEAGLEASRKSGGVAKPGHAPSKQFMAQQSMRHPQGHQGNKGKLYRQPSLMDKYRRSAAFNEIMEKNLHEDKAEHAKHGENVKRLEAIVGSENTLHLNTQMRSRMVAFEMVRHAEEIDDEEFVINPYCVASMPEPIRKGFLKKVFGILFFQTFVTSLVVAACRYVPVSQGANSTSIVLGVAMMKIPFFALGAIVVSMIFLGVLFCCRRKHPVNLVIFTCFTICFGLALGIITCLVDSDIFLFSSIGTLLFCGILLGLAFVVPSRKINVCNLSAVCVVLAISMMLAVQYGVKNSHWGGSVMCGVVVLCFSFWIIFDVQAVQIDLTADEYIIATVDLYLDVVNLFLWLIICMLYCFGMAAK